MPASQPSSQLALPSDVTHIQQHMAGREKRAVAFGGAASAFELNGARKIDTSSAAVVVSAASVAAVQHPALALPAAVAPGETQPAAAGCNFETRTCGRTKPVSTSSFALAVVVVVVHVAVETEEDTDFFLPHEAVFILFPRPFPRFFKS
jgi:hypothetical protein